MALEKKLVEKVLAYLQSRHIWHFVYVANVTYGLPDIIAIHHGKFVGLELKTEDGTGRPTLLQTLTRDGIIEAGGYAIISEDLVEIIELFERIDKECTL
jgi:hypothetical protein